MKFYSTKNRNYQVDIKEAVIKGLASDNGLFMPEFFPTLPDEFINSLPNLSLPDIALEVLKPFFCPAIPEQELERIVKEAFNFSIPLVKVKEGMHVLELFHGPTLAFKDVGARFLARIMAWFVKDLDQDVYVLAATSGDTGSAVANGFLNVEGVKVVVLYPKGMVSERQEKQFATLGQNITAIEIEGTFDDCQKLVKTAFLDKELGEKRFLTSANSINLARLLPQAVYYFYAFAQLQKQTNEKAVFSVPSGNFGNLAAGLIARKMGLPIDRFIAATNVNDIVPEYLSSGLYAPRPSVATLANAMDVGDPSNFVRIQDLFDESLEALKEVVGSAVIQDTQIRQTIQQVYQETGYILDPHGACACLALKEQMEDREQGVFLATAHPAKFPEVVETQIKKQVTIPDSMQRFLARKTQKIEMANSFRLFKEYLLS
jgi:threonine synthase